jgi:hypothetical protein
LDSQLLDPEFSMMLRYNDYTVEAVYHLFADRRLTSDPRAAQDALIAVIDASSLCADVHLTHTLRDTITLAPC